MGILRLFLAVDLVEEQQRRALDLIGRLQKGTLFTQSFPKWVDASQLHITMKFLGAVDAGRVPEIIRCVEAGIGSFPAFDLSVERLGVFPNPREPKVLWVGANQGKRQIVQLAARLDDALVRAGFEPEMREFHPHLTLARIKALRGASALMDVVESHRDASVGLGLVDHVTLYSSDLKPEGPEYLALHRWELRVKEGNAGNGTGE